MSCTALHSHWSYCTSDTSKCWCTILLHSFLYPTLSRPAWCWADHVYPFLNVPHLSVPGGISINNGHWHTRSEVRDTIVYDIINISWPKQGNGFNRKSLEMSFHWHMYRTPVPRYQISAGRDKEMVSMGNHWTCIFIDMCNAHLRRGTRYDRAWLDQISADRNNEVVSRGKHWRCISNDICSAHPCWDTRYDCVKEQTLSIIGQRLRFLH